MTEEQEKAIYRIEMNKDFAGMDNGCCVVNIADVETILNLTKEQDFRIKSLEQVHEYDMQMIDDVKGKAVELYNQIEYKDEIIKLMAMELENYIEATDKEIKESFENMVQNEQEA